MGHYWKWVLKKLSCVSRQLSNEVFVPLLLRMWRLLSHIHGLPGCLLRLYVMMWSLNPKAVSVSRHFRVSYEDLDFSHRVELLEWWSVVKVDRWQIMSPKFAVFSDSVFFEHLKAYSRVWSQKIVIFLLSEVIIISKC